MTDNACKVKEAQDNLAFLKNADKPTLENLSYALRHPETWPKGFHWDFSRCESCAMGLARALWAKSVEFPTSGRNKNEKAASEMARVFAMPYEEVMPIFLGRGDHNYPVRRYTTGHLWWKKDWEGRQDRLISPEMVADEIDRYLAERE